MICPKGPLTRVPNTSIAQGEAATLVKIDNPSRLLTAIWPGLDVTHLQRH